APMSARNMAHEGPARCCVESMTRSPVSAPVMVVLLWMRDKELGCSAQVLYDSAVRSNKRCYCVGLITPAILAGLISGRSTPFGGGVLSSPEGGDWLFHPRPKPLFLFAVS